LLVDLVIARRTLHRPLRVGLDGVDTAGKTTLADELASALRARGRRVLRASLDGFHLPRAHRLRRGADSPEGFFFDSFDYPALRRELLDPLGPGGSRSCRFAIFDALADAPVETAAEEVGVDAILLFDGIFLQRPELAGAWDLVIFVGIDRDTVLRRAAVRDAARFGSPQAAVARYRARYIPGQDLYEATCHPRDSADVVIDNNLPETPVLVRATRDQGTRPGGTAPTPTTQQRPNR
jgi:uridine kinase